MKSDRQILSLRLHQEERDARRQKQAEAAELKRNQAENGEDRDAMDVDDEAGLEDVDDDEDTDLTGSKVIVVHLGSHYLRLGLASDALPKSVPMVIARKSPCNESEEGDAEPTPKRKKLDDGSVAPPEKMFAPEFNAEYAKMCAELKLRMRANKRRLLPNSKELVVNYNSRVQPEIISEHNDPARIEWTEVPDEKAPNFFTGWDALRVPDDSMPRYKLFWPIQQGWYNEAAYRTKMALWEDVTTIIEDSIKKELGLARPREWANFTCVFVIPDLYDRRYVEQALEMVIRDLGFAKVAFMQESLAATYGAAFTMACVVDIGAQKTSIACVEDGMIIEDSRVNIKMGGYDATETFMKMMLFDHFPYADINLRRRYDWVLADELKTKFCTMSETDITVQLFDFHVRAPSQDTRKYSFKTYDETLLAAYGLFHPEIYDHSKKLRGRHTLIGPSRDLYNDAINDPISNAQADIVQSIAPHTRPEPAAGNGAGPSSAPVRPLPSIHRLATEAELPASATGSPAPEGDGTPAPAADAGGSGAATEPALHPSLRDDVLPVVGLDTAILTAVAHGARQEERKTRDFLGSIMVVGGGSLVPGFLHALEERLKARRPGYAKDILIAPPPRELDPKAVVWKGASVFGKLQSTSEVTIGRLEFDRCGSRVFAYKSLWAW